MVSSVRRVRLFAGGLVDRVGLGDPLSLARRRRGRPRMVARTAPRRGRSASAKLPTPSLESGPIDRVRFRLGLRKDAGRADRATVVEMLTIANSAFPWTKQWEDQGSNRRWTASGDRLQQPSRRAWKGVSPWAARKWESSGNRRGRRLLLGEGAEARGAGDDRKGTAEGVKGPAWSPQVTPVQAASANPVAGGVGDSNLTERAPPRSPLALCLATA